MSEEDEKYKKEKEDRIKREKDLWVGAYLSVSGSVGANKSSIPIAWANDAVDAFRKKFWKDGV